MPEIILIPLAKNIFRILKNEVRNKKDRKGGYTPINPSPINLVKGDAPMTMDLVELMLQGYRSRLENNIRTPNISNLRLQNADCRHFLFRFTVSIKYSDDIKFDD